ncbi:hypothetical protein K450DRAFT_243723 [Umbelopsis ramanniana AG]|uniref:Uncharacterized protein n=1 Tax=Umbelopsis ramanniana AG TaxID=1314678 RepID=A0AAD5E7W0_UMBRA|nr:uncharacterized protein K450DRAFT_243723 [Umbelopsis ramanniana AG]KAI8579073.1 hypothetical protein K450DRAFT_243723 [Umbelopsis ramanniana AG]
MLSVIRTNALRSSAPLKPFSTTAFLSTNRKSTPDKSRPDVHYYAADDNQAGSKKYPVSFLSDKELPSGSAIEDFPRAVIGWSASEGDINPGTFAENEEFADLLHKVIGDNVDKVDDSSLKGMAEWQQEGWLHVADERNPPPWGRIPLPEDIFGSVLLSKGIIQPNTYQRMPSHRFVTSNGLFQLSPPMQSILRSTLLEEIKQSKK